MRTASSKWAIIKRANFVPVHLCLRALPTHVHNVGGICGPEIVSLSSASCLAPRMVVKIYGFLQPYKWAILMRQPQCFFHPLPLIKIPCVQIPRNLPYYVILWFVCARHICITQKDCVAVRPYNLRGPPIPFLRNG